MNDLIKKFYRFVREEESLFHFMLDSGKDGFWILDLQEKDRLALAPQLLILLGYSADALPDFNDFIRHCLSAQDQLYIRETVLTQLDGSSSSPLKKNMTYRSTNGKAICFMNHFIVVRDETSTPVLLVCGTRKEETEDLISSLDTIDELGQSLLSNQTFYIVKLNSDGNYTYVNDFYCDETGITKDLLLGADVLLSVVPEDRSLCIQTLEQSKANPGIPYKVLLHGLFRNPSIRAIQWTFTYQTEKSNREREGEILCIGFDVTEKVKFERDFSVLLANMSDVLFIIDPAGFFTYVSPSWTTLYGYEIEETLGKSFVEFIHPEDIEKCSLALTKTVETGIPSASVEHRVLSKSGEWFWSNTQANIDRSSGEIILTSHNITERKVYEEKLKELALVASKTTDIIILSDADGMVTWVNEAFERQTGFTKDEVFGKNLSQFMLGPETDQHIIEEITRAIDRKEAAHAELIIYKKNSEKYWSDLSVTPVLGADGEITHIITVQRDITLRKQADDELKRIQMMLEQTNHVASVGGWELNLETEQLYWTQVTKEIHGVTPDYEPDVLSAITFFKEGENRERVLSSLKKSIKTGVPYDVEVELITIQGNSRWVRVIGKAEIHNGFCKRIYGAVQDITALKNAQDQILKSNQLLKKLTDRVPGFLFQFQYYDNGAMTFPYFSDGIYDAFGILSDEFAVDAKHLFSYIHPDDLSLFISSIEQSRANLQKWETDFRIIPPNRPPLWLRGESIPERLDDSVLWHGYLKDITQRKKNDQEILLSEAKYRSLFDSTSDAVMLLTEKDGFFDCNKATLRMFGCSSREEFCQLTPADLSPVTQPDGTSSNHLIGEYIKLAIGKKNHRFEWLFQRIDAPHRTFYGEVLLNSTTLNDQQIIQSVVRDITARKKAEHALKKARKRAEDASRSKSEFLANMSHEIRTPLNGVIGFTDLLMRTQLNETQQQYMTTVFKSANSLLDIINDILDFSKIEAGKLELAPEQTDLYDLGNQVADMVTYQAHNKGLEMLLNISPALPRYVWADAVRLRQILVNLLGNAAKFTEKGEIELKVELVPSDHATEKTFRFSVRDTGLGIEVKHQKKIFEAFAQEDSSTTRRFGGTGLGLTISNRLLGLMNSKLQLVSQPGKGSLFFFDVSFETIQSDAIQGQSIDRIKKVLIVDDNANNRIILRDMLLLKEIDAETVMSGAEAIEKINQGENYDAILMDYHMPGMNGLQAVRSIREITKNDPSREPVILLCSSADDETINLACEELAIHHKLVKPVKMQQLFTALSRLHSKEEVNPAPATDEAFTIEHKMDSKIPYKILIAEDNPINMLLARTILTKLRPNVTLIEVDNGKDAVSQCELHRPDLILMDIQMPVMNGYEATMLIRQNESNHRVTIIALTAGTVKGEKEKCIQAGMDDYITKPILRETLEVTLSKWLPDFNPA